MSAPEELALEALAHALSGYSDTEWEPDHLPDETKEHFRAEARRHAIAIQQAPALKPDDEPDKYRGTWQRIVSPDDSPKWLCGIKVSGPSAKSQYIEVTQDQARRILEMLSSEDTER